MTALLVHMPGAGKTAVPEACERTIPIFDGHTRYNLRLSFKRVDTVSTEGGYQGPVIVCAVKFFPVAGYDPKHFLITYLAAQHDIEIWLAPIAGSRLMVPYRMSMPTPMDLEFYRRRSSRPSRQNRRRQISIEILPLKISGVSRQLPDIGAPIHHAAVSPLS